MPALPHSGGCACFGLLPIPSSACIAWKFPAGTVHNPSLLKQPISNGMKHPARTSPSVVCFAPERWSLCAYYFPPRRSAPFRYPIKPNTSRPPKTDINDSASNRFILGQERMNHHNKTVGFKTAHAFAPSGFGSVLCQTGKPRTISAPNWCTPHGSGRFFTIFESTHWKETRHGLGCLSFRNVISAVFSIEYSIRLDE